MLRRALGNLALLRHFNQAGYQALADLVVADLAGASQGGCAALD